MKTDAEFYREQLEAERKARRESDKNFNHSVMVWAVMIGIFILIKAFGGF